MLFYGLGDVQLIGFVCSASLVLALFYRADISTLWIGFVLPWIIILGSAAFDISDYSRPVAPRTIGTVGSLIFILAIFIPHGKSEKLVAVKQALRRDRLWTLHGLLLIFFCANIAYSGYIPAIRLNDGVASGYLDFGIPSFNGLFNAYANALAITDFFLWCTRRKKRYLGFFLSILVIFLLLVSRQNIISVVVESFIIFILTVKKPSQPLMLLLMSLLLTVFGVLGDLRIGEASIANMARIRDEFSWLPNGSVWLFSYSYFNLLNVDNVINSSASALFDMSSLASLLPSVLRPAPSTSSYGELEVAAFAVGSFIRPIYTDVGAFGLFLIFIPLSLWGRFTLAALRHQATYKTICAYSVMFFCFSFSFFENFWFYLPVISQMLFIPAFSKFLFAKASIDGRAHNDGSHAPQRVFEAAAAPERYAGPA